MPLKVRIESDKLYFISDMHFFHRNILSYSPERKQFRLKDDVSAYTLEEHHEDLIATWNTTVGKDDFVVNLGDMFFNQNQFELPGEILEQLNGNMIWIKGNHDQSRMYRQIQRKIHSRYPVLKYHDGVMNGSQNLPDMAEILVLDKEMDTGTQMIVCTHYPMRSWNHSRHGSWHLYGHEHGRFTPQSIVCGDVGIDSEDFREKGSFHPISYEDIKLTITKNALKRQEK